MLQDPHLILAPFQRADIPKSNVQGAVPVFTGLADSNLDAFKQEVGYFYFHLLNRKDRGIFCPTCMELEKPHPSGGAARAGKDALKDMLWLSPADYTRDRETAKICILHHSG